MSALRIANSRGVPGTACAIVRDRRGVELLLVSHHVAFGDGAVVGDRMWALPLDAADDHADDRVLLGRVRGGELGRVTVADRVWFVDCALVELEPSVVGGPQWLADALAELRAIDGVVAATRGLTVCKHGAATGTTTGTIIDTTFLDTPTIADKRFTAPSQLLVQPDRPELEFATGGDSGAALLDDARRIVGMIWGTVGGGRAIAAPIHPVLEHLDVELA